MNQIEFSIKSIQRLELELKEKKSNYEEMKRNEGKVENNVQLTIENQF